MFKKMKLTPKQELLAEMKEVLYDLKCAIYIYENHVSNFKDSTSIVAQISFLAIEFYREYYAKLRYKYEMLYGDIEQYQEKIKRYFEWRKEIGLQCLMQEYDHYTNMSILESAMS